jgi:hypothetical protein
MSLSEAQKRFGRHFFASRPLTHGLRNYVETKTDRYAQLIGCSVDLYQ